MSSRAPIGHLAINRVSAATNQGCKSFVPKVQTYPEYLYFAVLSVMGEIKRRGSGTTFSEVSASKLLGLRIPAAEIHAQQEVADHLARVQDATWRIAALQTKFSSLSSALLPAARNEEFTQLT
jgi:type I restriction enzyme S subunit